MGKKKKDTRVSQISNIEDREAHLIFDYDSRTVRLYTNNATVMNRLDKQGIKYYRVIVLLFILLGSILDVDLVWKVADLFNGLMVLPNIVGLLILSPQVFAALRDYENNFLNMPK